MIILGSPKIGGGTFRGLEGLYWGFIGLYRDLGLGFPKIRGTFLEVPIIRTIVICGFFWGPLFRKLPC